MCFWRGRIPHKVLMCRTMTHAVLCRHYIELKQMMHSAPEVVHAFLDHLAEALIVYVCYQIDSGAQASMQCLTAASLDVVHLSA